MESESCKQELLIEIPPDIVKQEAEAVTAQYRRMARIPGFRPGHAPASIVRRHFKDDIRNEVVQTLLPRYFENAIKDKNLSIIGRPQFDDLKFEEDSPLKCTATFEVLPEFELKDYKGLEVEEGPTEVTESDLDETLKNLQQRAATYEPVEDRAAEDGDYVTVNYKGIDTTDPTAQPLEANDAMVHLAADGMVPAFTDNLRGTKAGDVRDFEVSYPEDYNTKPLAGKTFKYHVDVLSIKKEVIPELDDEFAKSVSEFKTLEELKAKVSENLAERKKLDVEAGSKHSLLDQLVSAHDFPLPDTLVQSQIDVRLESFLSRLISQGIDPRTVGLDWGRLRDEARPEAEKDVRGSLILEKVAEAEKIEVTEEDVDELIRDVAKERHEAPAAVKTRLTRDDELPRIRRRLRNQKALDLIYHNAKIKPKSETVQDQQSEG